MKLLVTYASPHGSTAEVATFIGRALQTYDIDVVVAHADDVNDVSDYDAFMIGSAIHASMWLPSISRFMFRFESELSQKPVYMFLMCIIALEEDGRQKARQSYLWGEALNRLNIPMENIAFFAGKLDWSQINGDERWLISTRYEGVELPSRTQSDYRDWKRIVAWVHDVAHQLKLPLDLSENESIQKTTKDETITEEEVENLEWLDNPGETAAI